MSHIPVVLIGRRPVLLMSVALLAGVAPLAVKLPLWVILLFVACTSVRVFLEFRAGRVPGAMLRLAIAAGGAAAVFLQFRTLAGLEAGLSILLVLISVKILEARKPRDFTILVVLGWFLCLTQLFFYQDLLNTLFALLVFLLLASALVQVHRRPEKRVIPSLRVASVLLLQALPLMLVLFLLFPRSHGGFRFHFGQSLFGQTGMSDHLYPGSVASIAQSDEIAFRAYFREGEAPNYPSLYWRGGVMWQNDGLSWSEGNTWMRRRTREPLAGKPVWQQIVMEPHGGRWMFALDWPASSVEGAHMRFGNYLRADSPVYTSRRYEVTSRPDNVDLELSDETRDQALGSNSNSQVSPAVQALVEGWRAEAATDEDVADRALRYFRKNPFTYTLKPGTYGANELDEFLFQRRTGFCEHFAGAFGTLMRVAGIPSRIVVGYQGGEFNRHGNYIIVRQSDAHAWCEIWLEGTGWTRVDPTAAIAPERTASGLDSYLQNSALSGIGTGVRNRSESLIGISEMLRDIRLAWDAVNYQWDLRVLNYDEDTQISLLASFGVLDLRAPQLLAWTAGTLAVILAAAAFVFHWRSRPAQDPVNKAYHRLCRRLAKAGVPRLTTDGPLALRDRAITKHPASESKLRAIFDLYIRLRYSADTAHSREFTRAVRNFSLLRPEQKS